MIRINLLPFRAARKKENIRRETSIFLLTFIFTTIVMFYHNGTLNGKISDFETRVAKTQAEIAKYRKSIREINRIKRELKTLENKTRIIVRLNRQRKWGVTFLDSINYLVIEKRMWLTNLSAKGNNINIKGIALDNKTVADFMTRLEKSNIYTNINLQTVTHKKIRKYNLKSFSITARKKPQPQKKKTAAKGKAGKK